MKIFLLLLSIISFQIPAKELSIGWELWYPYQFRDKQQQLIGLDFDILNAILKELALEANYTELPWKRHLQYIKTGDIDIAMGASFTKERDDFAYFSIPYRIEKINLFVKKGNTKDIKLTRLEDLIHSHYILGIEGGYFYGDKFQKLNQQIDFQSHINEVIDLEQNVKMLFKGYIDGFFADPITMKSFSEKYSIQNELESHPLVIYQTDVHFMLSKKSCSPETLMHFNQAIKTLQANGELDRIIKKWTLLD
jgi:polar amino acid transport system substrate-binding protein